jgi:hypothetical protein
MWKGKMRGFAMAKGIWIVITDASELPTKEDAVLDATTKWRQFCAQSMVLEAVFLEEGE